MQPKNAHTLNNAWKRQDTTKDLIVWFSDVMPNPAHAWTVRVADSKGYLGDYDATLQDNRFVIDTGQFADFPVGHYVLEIWETYSKDGKAETGIYPNPDSFVTFDINKNVVDDDLVKSFDLDEILGKAAARANKAIVIDGTQTLPAGSQATVDSKFDGERLHLTFKVPQGVKGDKGNTGDRGPTGPQGSKGDTGPVGPAPRLSVGSVTTLSAGSKATASVSGSNGSYTLNMGIPQGAQGANAPAPSLSIGTVDTLPAGSKATASVSGSNGNYALNVGIPQGLSTISTSFNLFGNSQVTPTFVTGNDESTQHLSAQRFGYEYGRECLPKTDIFISPLKGDTIIQSCVIRISDESILDSQIAFSFFNLTEPAHHIVPTTVTQTGKNTYFISATYQVTEDNFKLRLMNIKYFGLSSTPGNGSDAYIEIDSPFVGLVQSGGVISQNLLYNMDVVNPAPGYGTTNDAQGIVTYSASGPHKLFDMIRWSVKFIVPDADYRIRFVARGKGKLYTHVYPGVAPGEDGSSSDTKTSYVLSDEWRRYTSTFHTLKKLYGDTVKTMIFRFYAGDDDIDLQLDVNSVTLERVGE